MTSLTPLAEVPRRFGLDARKALGQHFLLDEATCARVAMLAGDLSGRGVGLAAVRAEAEGLGGTAVLENSPGQGTCLVIEVPLGPQEKPVERV